MKNLEDFHLSEEVTKTGQALQFDQVKWQEENTPQFTSDTVGINESLITTNYFKRYIDIYPQNISTNTSYYYWITSWLEKTFSFLGFIERFFLMRFFSLLLYLGTIVAAYHIAKQLFVTHLRQILFTVLIAFQPMLLATGVIVNIDIALIFGATLFFLGALGVITKPTYKSHLLLITGLLLAFLGKASGIAFVPVYLLVYLFFFQQKYQFSYQKILRSGFYAGSALLLLVFFSIPKDILATFLNLGVPSKFSSPLESLLTYLDKTIGLDVFLRTHTSYWGNFGWLDTKINTSLLHSIAFVELIAWIGILVFLFSKKIKDYLPQKSMIILSLGMIFFLQFAIRFYDWRVFDTTGKIVIGTPGRYFLPSLVPHLLILVTGLGFLFTKNKRQFTTLLKALTLSMILLCLYAIFDVIIPRYYL